MTALAMNKRIARDKPVWWHHIDYGLVALVVGISGFGTLLVYSATRGPATAEQPANLAFLSRQGTFIVLGLFVMGAVAAIDYRKLRALVPIGYFGLIALLVGVLVTGRVVNGARSWFQFGSFQVQPSEYGKVVLIVAMASFLASRQESVTFRDIGLATLLAGIPMGLIFLQPDLGTILVYLAILAGMVLVAGIKPRQVAVVLIVVAFLGGAAISSGQLKQYQIDRFTSLFDEDGESVAAQTTRFNVDQAQIAIGNGGLWGQGLFEGTQTRSNLVPEQQTDFIFTVAGEELGFAGSATLLVLFVALVFRIWRIASLTHDLGGTMICVGVLAMILFQVFQSVGMNLGIMPVTGIPLPFVSYGGSSVITSFASIGLVLSVHLHRFS
ncbi:MAG: rod shape-determining protein RodA [Acidimicrobiales bacterium]